MSGKRQNIQYLLALEPKGRGETPVSGYPRAVQCSQLKHQLARALNPARAAAYLS